MLKFCAKLFPCLFRQNVNRSHVTGPSTYSAMTEVLLTESLIPIIFLRANAVSQLRATRVSINDWALANLFEMRPRVFDIVIMSFPFSRIKTLNVDDNTIKSSVRLPVSTKHATVLATCGEMDAACFLMGWSHFIIHALSSCE